LTPGWALHAAGRAGITISSGKGKMSFDGEYLPVRRCDEFPASFVSGYEKQDPVLYSKKCQALESRLLDVIGSSEPITISAGKANYQLQPIDIEHWRIDLCGCGLWVSPRDFPAQRGRMHDLWLKRLGRKRGRWIIVIQGALRRWRAEVSRKSPASNSQPRCGERT
jgi:hypothetical protein